MCSTEIVVFPSTGAWIHRDDYDQDIPSDAEIIDVGVCREDQINEFVERYLA